MVVSEIPAPANQHSATASLSQKPSNVGRSLLGTHEEDFHLRLKSLRLEIHDEGAVPLIAMRTSETIVGQSTDWCSISDKDTPSPSNSDYSFSFEQSNRLSDGSPGSSIALYQTALRGQG